MKRLLLALVLVSLCVSVASAQVPSPRALVAPTDCQAILTATTEIRVTWQDTNLDELGYRVELSDTGGLAWRPSYVPANTTVRVFPSYMLREGTAYLFRVSAYKWLQYGPYSNVAAVSTGWHVTPPPPAAICDLDAMASGPGEVTLQWSCVDPWVQFVVIWRIEVGVDTWFEQVGMFSFSGTAAPIWQDKGVTPGNTYGYYVEQMNAGGWSPSPGKPGGPLVDWATAY